VSVDRVRGRSWTIGFYEAVIVGCGTITPSDDATVFGISIDRPNGAVPMMPPAIGVILILVGIGLFIVDLSVTNHGLLTAEGIVNCEW
jgi:hypothetical protein